MFGIGMPEMILILAVALIVIGPKKLPDLAKSLGKALGEFKKATSDLKESMQVDTELKEVKSVFNEVNRESQKATRPSTGGEDAQSVGAAMPEGTVEPGEPKTGDRMEPLKDTVDRLNPAVEDAGVPSGTPSSDTGFDRDPQTRKG
jgi:sec-independent protein translocase protein TatB